MKTANRKHTTIFVGILLAVIWIILVLTLTDFTRLGFTGWFAFLYVPVSIALVSYCVSAQNTIKNDSGTLGIPIYYSAVFLVIGILLNGAFLLLGSADMKSIIIALDVILLAVYFIVMLAAGKHINSVNARIEKLEANTAASIAVSRELGKALALAEDQELHQELLRLKEKVDYTGSSGNSSEDEVILRKAVELRAALSSGSDNAAVRDLINQLGRLWAARNV